MISIYRVTLPDGQVLAAAANFQEARDLVAAHPGAEVRAAVRYKSCSEHPAYEAANCPDCGTAARF